MLRLAVAATLVFLGTSAFAQEIDEMKGIKFGVGCVGPVSTFAANFGSCDIDGKKSRIWCPGGKIFDRALHYPQSVAVSR